MKFRIRVALGSCLVAVLFLTVGSSAQTTVEQGTLARITVPGPSLEGNLMGAPSAPEVSVYLPPSYTADASKRYPVLYMLHGYGSTDLRWFGPDSRQAEVAADRAFSSGLAREMIVVMPNAYNVYGGSMYSSSVTTGDWEGYIADDLVAYMDSNYRTIPNRESRGLAGHSMGGYGALRIDMRRPDAFAALYNLSACCLMNNPGVGRGGGDVPDVIKAEAAAWSPNPNNPPDYYDLPVADGEVQPRVAALWQANSPLVMVPQFVANLRKYSAIGGEVGLQDGLIGSNMELAEMLVNFGVDYQFATYVGGHSDKMHERFGEHVLPFFSEALVFED